MSTTVNADDRRLLASRLADAQNLDDAEANRLADRVLDGPPDIARAAVGWARTGEMPDTPNVLGRTPRGLSERFAPSQVFTGLMLLRSDPHVAEQVLHRGVDRWAAIPDALPLAASPTEAPLTRRSWVALSRSLSDAVALITRILGR